MGAGASPHKLKMFSATATTPTKRRLRLLLIHQHKSKRAPLCLRMKLLLILLFDLLSQSLQSKEQNLEMGFSHNLLLRCRDGRGTSIWRQVSSSVIFLPDTAISNFQCRRHVTTSAAIPAIFAIIPISCQIALHCRQWCLVQVSQIKEN